MVRRTAWTRTLPGGAMLAAAAVGLAALLVPAVFEWQVHAGAVAPLAARWQPRFGPGTIPAVVIAVAAWRWAPGFCRRSAWGPLIVVAFAAALGWLVALAAVDGRAGLGSILTASDEYLPAARRVSSASAMLHHFIAGIGATSA